MTDLNLKALLKNHNIPICIDEAECKHKVYRKLGAKPLCLLPFLNYKYKGCVSQRYPDAKEKVTFT